MERNSLIRPSVRLFTYFYDTTTIVTPLSHYICVRHGSEITSHEQNHKTMLSEKEKHLSSIENVVCVDFGAGTQVKKEQLRIVFGWSGDVYWVIWVSIACAAHSGAAWRIFSRRLLTWKHRDWICLSQVGRGSRAARDEEGKKIKKISFKNINIDIIFKSLYTLFYIQHSPINRQGMCPLTICPLLTADNYFTTW